MAGDGLRNLVITPPETLPTSEERKAKTTENSLPRKLQNSGSGLLVSFANTLKKSREAKLTSNEKIEDSSRYRD